MNIVYIAKKAKFPFRYFLAILCPIAISAAFRNKNIAPIDMHVSRPFWADDLHHGLAILRKDEDRPSPSGNRSFVLRNSKSSRNYRRSGLLGSFLFGRIFFGS